MTLGFRPGRSAHDALMALASSLCVARELPPVVALPERVGGPRDRQLPMRLTEGEADATIRPRHNPAYDGGRGMSTGTGA